VNNTPPTFWRSPRLTPEPPVREVEIKPPPSAPGKQGSLATILIPSLVMMAAMGIMAYFMSESEQGGGPTMYFMLIMMVASPIGGVIIYFMQKNKAEEEAERRTREYRNLLRQHVDELKKLQERQQEIAHYNDPSPEECLEIVVKLERALWARSPSDEDYLSVRVGLGERASTIAVKVPQSHDPLNIDPLIAKAQEVAGHFAKVPFMPVHLNIRNSGIVGVVGPKEDVQCQMRAILIQLATHHAPSEVKLVVVYPQAEQEIWSWARWLPHVWDDNRQHRFVANNPEGIHHLFSAIEGILDQRKQRLMESGSTSERPSFAPNYVFVLAAPELTKDEPLIHRLLQEGPELGAFAIFVRSSSSDLPKNCREYVNYSRGKARIVSPQASSIHSFDEPDQASLELADRFSRKIAPIRVRSAVTKEIPSTVNLLELFEGAERVEDLKVADRWQKSQKYSRSLTASVGIQRGGQPRMLDLHEKAHGPNGLVAGMVGAGKSVVLETLVASLAVNYHPHKVAFVLVDFKGGGMAKPFENMPHTLGVITNLQEGNLAVRALTSMRVEGERRQELFNSAGVNHIDDYQKLYYSGRVTVPLPYLVIIVDEFAEMKSEQPEVAKEFIKIARLGRALGFRLILAMQKPAGIVDAQIEANTRFRLCLRVAQTEDSQAMLKRPDAAYLAGNGRAYFQVGANEIFELFQVAWGGATYDPGNLLSRDPREISAVALSGRREVLYQPERPQLTDEEDISQLKAIVTHLEQQAEALGIEKLPGLWLPPLPKQLSLAEVRSPDQGWLHGVWQPGERWCSPVVGLLDDPSKQSQSSLRIPFGEEGAHLAIYGEPGSGKTTLIQTIITSLALDHPPSDVNIYVIDFGGRLLRMYETLPHVGGVVTADEEERLQRLLDYLLREMDRRREILGGAKVATLREYRRMGKTDLPAILVILDNYANFIEANEEAEDTIIKMVRDGGNLGIHLVLTATSASALRFRVSSNITLAVALNLVEKSDYSAIVGKTETYPTSTAGRGLVRLEPPLEFQTALPGNGQTDLERNADLRDLIDEMAEAWPQAQATPIPMLPNVVSLKSILITDGAARSSPGLAAPLGLNVSDLSTFSVNLADGPNFLITGPMQSGRTTLLRTWLLGLACQNSPKDIAIYIFDSRKEGLADLARLPHVRAYISEQEQSERLLTTIDKLLLEREQIIIQKRRQRNNGGSHQDGGQDEWPALVIVVDDLIDPFNDPLSDMIKDQLGGMLRKGRSLGLYVLASATASDVQSKGWNEPIKTLKDAQIGFMMGSSSDLVFNLRLPYQERDKMLPVGEAYWSRHGVSRRVKIAEPFANGMSMTEWQRIILAQYGETGMDSTVSVHSAEPIR